MTNIEFDEPQFSNKSISANQKTIPSSMTKFVIKIGLAKNESQANVLLASLSIIFFLIAGLITYFSSANSQQAENTVPADIQERINAGINVNQ